MTRGGRLLEGCELIFIPRRIHGLLDYAVAFVLIALPSVCGFADHFVAAAVSIGLGVVTLIYSLCTDYERGALPIISFQTHLLLDVANAGLLAVSPFLMQFAGYVWLPHVSIAACEIAVILLSSWKNADSKSAEQRHPTRSAKINFQYPETLRAAIDRGETGDKVAFPDPAAAPLGTDDEAAGVTYVARRPDGASANGRKSSSPE
jgi:hypothetical protein